MDQTELDEITRLHGLWLRGDRAGERANLSKARLSVAGLRGANLYGANLYGADLRGANLYGANLSVADLRRANLYGADLRGADLSGANLSGADLSVANLYGADLRGENLYGANLSGARGVVCLPVGDPTYRPVAVDHGDKWMIASGCRWFTVAEAREHWGVEDYERGALLGNQYVAAVDWLEANSDAIRGQWA